MANAKYDQTSTIMSGQDWVGSRVYAFLLSGATYQAADQNLSQIKTRGGSQVNVTEIQNKAIGPGGEALGVAAVFSVTPKGDPYQVVLGWDRNTGDYPVLCYYDQDDQENPIGLTNNGTLIVRPLDYDQSSGRGPWFVF